MDIILFIGLFIVILLLLVAIAKYGIREKSYEDILKEKGIDASNLNSANDAKKKVKKVKKTPQQQPQSVKKQKNESESESEEELTPVHDPFTNTTIRNRKPVPVVAAAAPQPAKSANIGGGVVKSSSTTSSNSSQAPKTITKPNIVVSQPPKQPKIQITNGDGDHENGEFIVHGVKKPKHQPQQQQQQPSDNEAPVKQQSQAVTKAAVIVEPVKPVLLVNGNHVPVVVVATNGSDHHDNGNIVSKKELERANSALIEKDKLIESSAQTINKLKSDIEKYN